MPENPIPDEIMREAGKALGSPDFTREMLQVRVARALMTERERAADAGYRVCAETRHVTLGDAVRAAILNPSEKNNG